MRRDAMIKNKRNNNRTRKIKGLILLASACIFASACQKGNTGESLNDNVSVVSETIYKAEEQPKETPNKTVEEKLVDGAGIVQLVKDNELNDDSVMGRFLNGQGTVKVVNSTISELVNFENEYVVNTKYTFEGLLSVLKDQMAELDLQVESAGYAQLDSPGEGVNLYALKIDTTDGIYIGPTVSYVICEKDGEMSIAYMNDVYNREGLFLQKSGLVGEIIDYGNSGAYYRRYAPNKDGKYEFLFFLQVLNNKNASYIFEQGTALYNVITEKIEALDLQKGEYAPEGYISVTSLSVGGKVYTCFTSIDENIEKELLEAAKEQGYDSYTMEEVEQIKRQTAKNLGVSEAVLNEDSSLKVQYDNVQYYKLIVDFGTDGETTEEITEEITEETTEETTRETIEEIVGETFEEKVEE